MAKKARTAPNAKKRKDELEFNQRVRKDMRAAAAATGLTYRQLAKKCRASATTLHGWLETGRTPHFISVAKVCLALGVSVDELIDKHLPK
jgi:transcriptional regulator with XRE-family HTH domain